MGRLLVAVLVLSSCDSEPHDPVLPQLQLQFATSTKTEPANETSPDPPETTDPPLALSRRPGGESKGQAKGFPSNFLGRDDSAIRHALATEPIAQIKKGTGGRSLGFKLTLADGTEAYFKPEQSFSAAHFYAELGSYYLDRELGLGRVPPTVGRQMPWKPLAQKAAGDPRLKEVRVQPDGTVRGALIWWVPEPLEPLPIRHGWERTVRLEGPLSITPYQRPWEYRREVQRWKRTGEVSRNTPLWNGEVSSARAAELSDLVLFDYLTANVDRWGGDNTNVRTRKAGGPLIYLDNGAGFLPGRHRIGLIDARLHRLQRFRRSTVQVIQQLDMERFKQRMATDPLYPFLTEHHLEGLEVRRRELLAHVSKTQQQFEERAFPW